MEKLQKLISLCKASVTLDINDHKSYYESVGKHLEEALEREDVTPERVAKMTELDTIVRLQFYPHTSVGFNLIYGTDVDEVLDEALAMFGEEGKI